MRLLKIIVIVLFVLSLTNADVCRNGAFQKENSNPESGQSISSGFESVISAVILSRENQTGKKVVSPEGLQKSTLVASDYSPKYKFSHFGNFAPLYVFATGTNEHTLISLHCLLTV